MKINNETKVGLLTVAALALLIMGFNFLKGKDLFDRSKKIYAVFTKLGSLANSNEVKINGLTIGTVYEMQETDKDVSGIRVTIRLTRDINIPANSVAYISANLVGIGSSSIIIEPGDSKEYLKHGDQIETRIDEGILGGLSSEVAPTLTKVRQSLDSLNRVFGNLNRLMDGDTKNNLQHTIANFSQISNSLNRLLSDPSSSLNTSLNNLSAITSNLKNNNDSITAIISNAGQFTATLSKLELEKTMDTLQSAISSLKTSINKISSNEGTLGALINDRTLYNKLTNVMLSAEILLDDLRAHPKRYVNLSIFGRKDRGGALTSPSIKDSIPK
ncbi:MAG TPA: MlaD family protein [Chitinophagaceae bacterium]|nr:MlaD family protein [Chitinophagaceae bacterium]